MTKKLLAISPALGLAALFSVGCATSSSTGPAASSSDAAPAAAAPADAAPAAGADSEFGPNLALNKPAVCSSVEKNLVAAKAVDGSNTTRWGSDFFTDADPENAWIFVDLGQKSVIKTVLFNWEAAYGKAFKVQVSDDAKDWKTVDEQNDGHAGKMVSKLKEPVSARYVKMQGVKRGSPYGYSLWDFEVYGK